MYEIRRNRSPIATKTIALTMSSVFQMSMNNSFSIVMPIITNPKMRKCFSRYFKPNANNATDEIVNQSVTNILYFLTSKS